ncbi:uncharacterized protein LOC133859846 [Alnus glutinosa]|uniref:uncharacterized protein LOC133859846 n=1 Tax=Alnus glutinosa TaxID=3517 RepID=UPI002D79C1B8|nr:uncharacterized protein LOC133859846 [Alnus glutinosa]
MQEDNWELSVCPSFSSYSSDKLADIAAKVVDGDDGRHRGEELDDDFEFVSVSRADDDVVVVDGQIGPVFPVFNRDLLSKSWLQGNEDHDGRSLRVPLKKLFVDERDPTTSFSSSSSSSSSEDEEGEGELEGVPPGTYCVWTPNNNNSAKASPSRCKKSNSTGTKTTGSSSSKRWRLSSLLRRSNSEGKNAFVFLTPKKEEIRPEKAVNREPGTKEKKVKTVSSAHEAFYTRNRAMREGDKRRTYLPYRQDLVGFWANVGALGKTFPPF